MAEKDEKDTHAKLPDSELNGAVGGYGGLATYHRAECKTCGEKSGWKLAESDVRSWKMAHSYLNPGHTSFSEASTSYPWTSD